MRHLTSSAPRIGALIGALAALFASGAAAEEAVAGDSAKGARVFQRCAVCHTFDPAQRRAGPHLKGLFGRKAGSVEGHRYSPAMAKSDVVWSEETLRAFLKNPRANMPGTTMVIGVPRDSDLNDLLAYLKEKSAE